MRSLCSDGRCTKRLGHLAVMRRNIRTIAVSLSHHLDDRELHGLVLLLVVLMLGTAVS